MADGITGAGTTLEAARTGLSEPGAVRAGVTASRDSSAVGERVFGSTRPARCVNETTVGSANASISGARRIVDATR